MAGGLPQLIWDGTYFYIYGLGPIAMVSAQYGDAFYYLTDGLGSVTAIVDESYTPLFLYVDPSGLSSSKILKGWEDTYGGTDNECFSSGGGTLGGNVVYVTCLNIGGQTVV